MEKQYANNRIVIYIISGLIASTIYYVYWAAEDAAGNQSTIVPETFTTTDTPADVTLTTLPTPIIPLFPGTTDNLIYSVSMEVSGGTAYFFGFIFTPNGTYSETDFDQFNFYHSVGVDDFGSATLIGSQGFFSGDPEIPDGSIGIVFEDIYATYTDETVYWYVTADVTLGATLGNTFGLNAPTPESNFGIDGEINPIDGGLAESNIFTIQAAPPRTVTSPNGGEDAAVGSTLSIGWNIAGFAGTDLIEIRLSTDGGSTYSMLNDGTFDMYNGSYDWTVTDNIGTNNLIQIANTSLGVTDESDAVFTISSAAESITMLTPNGGEALTIDQPYLITFNTTGILGTTNMQIGWSNDGGANYQLIVQDQLTNLASGYSWTPDNSFVPASNYLTGLPI